MLTVGLMMELFRHFLPLSLNVSAIALCWRCLSMLQGMRQRRNSVRTYHCFSCGCAAQLPAQSSDLLAEGRMMRIMCEAY